MSNKNELTQVYQKELNEFKQYLVTIYNDILSSPLSKEIKDKFISELISFYTSYTGEIVKQYNLDVDAIVEGEAASEAAAETASVAASIAAAEAASEAAAEAASIAAAEASEAAAEAAAEAASVAAAEAAAEAASVAADTAALQTQTEDDVTEIEVVINNQPSNTQTTTKKKALLIGINYNGTSNKLDGCINDVINIKTTLTNKFNFDDITLLTDNTTIKPTKVNIMNEIKKILQNSQAGDKLFFSFSGHGTYKRDTNNDEKDGRDEVFVSLDFKYITDDEIKQLIQTYLKKNVTVFMLSDCCNSGTILDLKYQYLDSTKYNTSTKNNNNTETEGNIFMISGCMDTQLSADAYIDRTYQGAMTWSFLNTINNNSVITWNKLVENMRSVLINSGYDQTPQLSSGRSLNITEKFYLS